MMLADSYFQTLANKLANPLVVFGLAGQGVFMLRFVWQWYCSERVGRSYVPLGFWYLSILGGMMTLAYALIVIEPVLILAQSLGLPIYIRNLVLIHREKARIAAAAGPKREMEGLAVAREEPSI